LFMFAWIVMKKLIGGREAGKHREEKNHHSIAKTRARVTM